MSRQVKDQVLEAFLAQTLDSAARTQVELLVASSPDDQARVAELRAESLAFLIQHPPAAFVAKLAPPKARAWWATPWAWVPLGALVAAGLALFVVQEKSAEREDPEVTVKGERALALTIHRRTETGSEVLAPDAVVHAGDELRFSVTSPARGFVAVFSGDALTVLVPSSEGQAVAAPMGLALLDGAGQLDEAPGPERFALIWSAEPFTVAQGRAAVSAASTDVKWRVVRRELQKR